MKLQKSLQQNTDHLKGVLSSDDVTFLSLKIKDVDALLIFVNDLIDKNNVGELILRPMQEFNGAVEEKTLFQAFHSPEKKCLYTADEVITDTLLGNAILLVDGLNSAFSFGLKFFEKRAILSENITIFVV